MPLDLSGFVAPEQKFEGLYKIGESLKKEKTDAEKLASANRKTLQSSLKYMVNPKDYYTGTIADPQINQKLFEAAQSAYDFIEQNPTATDVQLKSYMNPMIQELSDYSWKAKTARKAIEDAKKTLDPKYYDKGKFDEAITNAYFRNEDGTAKDAASIQIGNPFDILDTHPEIATSRAFDEWLKSQPTKTDEVKTTFGTRPGTVTEKQVKISAPSWGIPEVDDKNQPIVDERGVGRIIPRYQLATDGYETITHDGKPVKLLTDEDFGSIMRQHPSMEHFVNAQLRQHLPEYKDEQGNPIQLGTPKADLVAKNILWEELNRRNVGNYQIKDYKVTTTRAGKAGGRGGAGGGEAVVRDAFSDITNYLDDVNKGIASPITKDGKVIGAPINALPGDIQIALTSLAAGSRKGKSRKYNSSNMYIRKNDQGVPELVDFKNDELIMPLDYTTVNAAIKQPGKEAKEKVIEEGKKQPSIIGKGMQKVKETINKFTGKSKDPLNLGL